MLRAPPNAKPSSLSVNKKASGLFHLTSHKTETSSVASDLLNQFNPNQPRPYTSKHASRVPIQFNSSKRPLSNFDPANLSTKRPPDIDPAIMPGSYLEYRYLRPRGVANQKLEVVL